MHVPWRRALGVGLAIVATLGGARALAATTALTADPSFGNQGQIVAAASKVAVQSTGAVIGVAPDPNGLPTVAVKRYRADGSSDPTFGTHGVTTLSLIGLAAVVVDPSDRIVVVGTDPDYQHILVARLTRAGLPDTSFGSAGIAKIAGGPRGSAGGDGAAVDGSGRVIVTGWISAAQVCSGALTGCMGPWSEIAARLDTHGTPDPSFGTDGLALLPYGFGAAKPAVAPDGSIVVAGGSSGLGTTYGYDGEVDVTRLTAVGVTDPTFGTGGRTTLPYDDSGFFWQHGYAAGVRVDGQGRALVGTGRTITRLTPFGAVDSTFGKAGSVVLPAPWTDISALLYATASKRIVVVGTSSGFPERTLLRVLGTTGSALGAAEIPDSFFAHDGALGPAGKVVVSYGDPRGGAYIARYATG